MGSHPWAKRHDHKIRRTAQPDAIRDLYRAGMSQVALLDYFERWVRLHSGELEADGLTVEFGRGQEVARSEHMAFWNIESSEWIGELLVWDTGEAELGATRRSDGDEVNEHHQVNGIHDLDALLMRLVRVVDPK